MYVLMCKIGQFSSENWSADTFVCEKVKQNMIHTKKLQKQFYLMTKINTQSYFISAKNLYR